MKFFVYLLTYVVARRSMEPVARQWGLVGAVMTVEDVCPPPVTTGAEPHPQGLGARHMGPARVLSEYAELRIRDDPARPAVAVLTGELDLACAAALATALCDAVETCPRGVGVDMSEVVFCDCAALAAVRTASGFARHLGRPFAVGRRSSAVARLLQLNDVDGTERADRTGLRL